MDQMAFLLNIIKYLLVEWEVAIIGFVMLCAIVAIILGIAWLFLRKDILLFILGHWKKLLEM